MQARLACNVFLFCGETWFTWITQLGREIFGAASIISDEFKGDTAGAGKLWDRKKQGTGYSYLQLRLKKKKKKKNVVIHRRMEIW